MEIPLEEDELLSSEPVYLCNDRGTTQTDEDGLAVDDPYTRQLVYLLQYPLRQKEEPYEKDFGPPARVRIKPIQKKLELQYDLSPEGMDMDDDADDYKVVHLPRLKLKSNHIVPKTNYAVGVFEDGALHLTPIEAILRMTPSLDHVDQVDATRKEKEKEDARVLSAGESESDVETETKKTAKPVTMKFRRNESERAAAYRKLSHAYFIEQQEAEPWRDLQVRHVDSNQADRAYKKLLHVDRPVVISDNEDSDDDMMGGERKTQGYFMTQPGFMSALQTVTGHAPRKKSALEVIDEKVRTLMERAYVLPFNLILKALKAFTPDELGLVLKVLKRHCFVIQGLWVLRGDTRLATSRSIFWATLIVTFDARLVIPSLELYNDIHIDGEDANIYVERIAVRNKVQKQLELKYPRDDAFIETFPQIIATQQRELKTLRAELTAVRKKEVVFTTVESKIVPQLLLNARGQRLSTSEQSMCEEVLEAYLSKHGIASRLDISKQFDLNGSVLHESVFQANAIEIKTGFFIRRQVTHKYADFNRYRTVVVNLFMTHTQLKKSDVVNAVREQLDTDITDVIYGIIMKELAHTTKKTYWKLKIPEGDLI